MTVGRQIMRALEITCLGRDRRHIANPLTTVLMIPLVATSNNWSVRRLGAARWNRLHRLTYPAAITKHLCVVSTKS